MADYDVVIIGAGPAGSSAAIQCLKAGLSVLIIERSGFPRDRPGETLHPGVELLLNQLGVHEAVHKAGFLRHEGHWVCWNSSLRYVPFGRDKSGSWLGYQAWRSDFDAILLERARELNGAVLQPCKAVRPILTDERVSGLITSDGQLRARWIIDAGGGRHWLATNLNLEVSKYSQPMIAHFGYAEGSCPERDNAPLLNGEATGWTWTARVRPGLYQWTRLTWEQSDFDRSWLPQEFAALIPRGFTRGADVTWRIVDEMAGKGYFMVGDAAAVLDPTASHGVLKAIMSGMMAGHAISNISRNRLLEEQYIDSYKKWFSGWFLTDVYHLQRFYMSLLSHPVVPFTHQPA